MPKTTQLFSYHAENAKLTEFAGFQMPLWYSSTSEEHMAVRNRSGVFDVSHMGRIQVSGRGATEFIERLVPSKVREQPAGKAFYTLLLDDLAGILDDLIIMRLAENKYLVVVNAANAELDLKHIRSLAPSQGIEIEDLTPSSAMLAVQGPEAESILQPITDLDLSQLKRFRCEESMILGQPCLISRTGYTGEDGFELIIPGATNESPGPAMRIWEKVVASSTACGLSARDSLRLEAGFPLHGFDIDSNTNPFQADLSWVISPGKQGYIGSGTISDLAGHPPDVIRRGLVLDEGIPRHGFEIDGGSESVGVVTSGTFSPILRKGIALCRVKSDLADFGRPVTVQVRRSHLAGRIVKPPFYDESLFGWKRSQRVISPH